MCVRSFVAVLVLTIPNRAYSDGLDYQDGCLLKPHITIFTQETVHPSQETYVLSEHEKAIIQQTTGLQISQLSLWSESDVYNSCTCLALNIAVVANPHKLLVPYSCMGTDEETKLSTDTRDYPNITIGYSSAPLTPVHYLLAFAVVVLLALLVFVRKKRLTK